MTAIVADAAKIPSDLRANDRGRCAKSHLLREYRTRLIADVVTGKLDAREAAARLPDATEEMECLTDTEIATEESEEEEDTYLDAVAEETEV